MIKKIIWVRYGFLLILLTTQFSNSYCQDKKAGLLRFDGSIHTTKMDIDSLDTEYAVLPGISLSRIVPVNDKIKYRVGGGFAIKGTNSLAPYYKFRLHYVTVQAAGIYRPSPNLELDAGLQGGYLLSSKLISSADYSSKPKLPGYQTELNLITGVGFQIQDNLFLSAHYYLPQSPKSFHQFSVSLNYYFTPDKLGQKSKDTKQQAYLQIAEMKNSVLLVRLASADKKVTALRQQGLDSLAYQVVTKQRNENLGVIKAFRKHFDFCPVYFFYNSQTPGLLQGKKVTFLGDDLKEQADDAMPEKNYFIAELGILNPVFSDTNDASYYSVLSDATKYGFIIYDRNLHLPSPPFPYFVKGGDMWTERSTEQLIWLMNKELHSFYNLAISGD